jgi:hypothetical protein
MRMSRVARVPVVLFLLVAACAPPAAGRERIVGGPCEGCEAVFDRRPAAPAAEVRIAPAGEPGEKLRLEGTVRDRAGKPTAGIIVYAYHTDARGVYPPDTRAATPSGRRHGTLRGWARTDATGRYAFATIRPASYPDSDIPQHVHMHVIEPGRCTYWIDDVHFTDDPFVKDLPYERLGQGRGGRGLVTPSRGADGTWRARRDIRLGEGIADYPG